MAQFLEAVFTPPCDAGFDFGHGNLSLNAAPVITTVTGVSFGTVRVGTGTLPDTFVWTIILSGTVSGAPTIVLEGTLDGTNWFILDTFNVTTSQMREISSHAGVGVPTHILGIRARISGAGTGTGTATVLITG
jgi:hypothetical protein